MNKKEMINKILSLGIEYPMIIVSYADWNGGRENISIFGKEAEDILMNGAGDFNYVEFVAPDADSLYKAIKSGKHTFLDEWEYFHEPHQERLYKLEDFIPGY